MLLLPCLLSIFKRLCCKVGCEFHSYFIWRYLIRFQFKSVVFGLPWVFSMKELPTDPEEERIPRMTCLLFLNKPVIFIATKTGSVMPVFKRTRYAEFGVNFFCVCLFVLCNILGIATILAVTKDFLVKVAFTCETDDKWNCYDYNSSEAVNCSQTSPYPTSITCYAPAEPLSYNHLGKELAAAFILFKAVGLMIHVVILMSEVLLTYSKEVCALCNSEEWLWWIKAAFTLLWILLNLIIFVIIWYLQSLQLGGVMNFLGVHYHKRSEGQETEELKQIYNIEYLHYMLYLNIVRTVLYTLPIAVFLIPFFTDICFQEHIFKEKAFIEYIYVIDERLKEVVVTDQVEKNREQIYSRACFCSGTLCTLQYMTLYYITCIRFKIICTRS